MNENKRVPFDQTHPKPVFANVRRIDLTLVLTLFTVSLLLRLIPLLVQPFDGLYGQDAYAYFDFAGELRQMVSSGRTPGTFFWPLGYPSLLAAAFSLSGTSATAGQRISILMGALIPVLLYLLARQSGAGRGGALCAGIVMMVCGQAIQSSIVIMADIPGLAWVTLSATALAHYLQPSDIQSTGAKPYWLIGSAILLALGCITRWLSLALVLPWGAALLILWRGHIRWRTILPGVFAATLVFIPQILYSHDNPYPTLNNAWVEGWSPENMFRSAFTNVDGHFQYEQVNVIFYAQVFNNAYYLAPIFTLFLLIGGLALAKRQRYTALVLLVGWAVLPYFFLAGIPYQNIRFPLIVFPAVAVLVGIGLEAAGVWLVKYISKAIVYIGAASLLIFGASQTLRLAYTNISTFISNQQADKEAAQWAAEHVPDGATVYTFGLTLTLKHYTSLNVYEIYYETPETLAQKWTHGQDDYLMVNGWNIENQWAGQTPQVVYHWLRNQRGLIKIGTNGYYTLYRVKG